MFTFQIDDCDVVYATGMSIVLQVGSGITIAYPQQSTTFMAYSCYQNGSALVTIG